MGNKTSKKNKNNELYKDDSIYKDLEFVCNFSVKKFPVHRNPCKYTEFSRRKYERDNRNEPNIFYIKFTPVNKTSNSAYQRFYENAVQKEAKFFSEFNHPNIVKCIGTFKHMDIYTKLFHHCLQFEYDENAMLLTEIFDKNNGKLLKETQIMNYLVQIILAMNYMNQKNFYHRYVTYYNMLIDSNDMIKICDTLHEVMLYKSYPFYPFQCTNTERDPNRYIINLHVTLDFLTQKEELTKKNKLDEYKIYSKELRDLIELLLKDKNNIKVEDLFQISFINEHCINYLIEKVNDPRFESTAYKEQYEMVLKIRENLIKKSDDYYQNAMNHIHSQSDLSIECFDKAIYFGHFNIESHEKKLMLLLVMKKYDNALEFCNYTINKFQNNILALCIRSLLFQESNQKDLAFEYCKKAVELDDKNLISRIFYYYILFIKNGNEVSLNMATNDINNLPFCLFRCIYYLKLGNIKSAICECDSAIDKNISTDIFIYLKCLIYLKLEEYENVLCEYNKLTVIDNPEFVNIFGFVMAKLNYLKLALNSFEKSCKMNPNIGDYYLNKAYVYDKLKNEEMKKINLKKSNLSNNENFDNENEMKALNFFNTYDLLDPFNMIAFKMLTHYINENNVSNLLINKVKS